MKLTLAIQPLDEADGRPGGYFAQIEEMPAVLTEGETLEEVRANIREALTLYLSYLRIKTLEARLTLIRTLFVNL